MLTANNTGRRMITFLLKVWGLAKPYRVRLFLGVLTGIIGGLIAPLMIATAMFVYGAVTLFFSCVARWLRTRNSAQARQGSLFHEFANSRRSRSIGWNRSAGFARAWLVDSGRKRSVAFAPAGGPPSRLAVWLLAPELSA